VQPDLDHTRRALTRRYGILISALLLVFALGVYGQVSRARSKLQRRQVEQLARTAVTEAQLSASDSRFWMPLAIRNGVCRASSMPRSQAIDP
jgi:type II secretory pathway pseudopilin PulG